MPYQFGQPRSYSFANMNTPVWQDTQLAPIVKRATNTAGFPSMSTPKRTLTQRATDAIGDAVRPVVGNNMADKVSGLFDYTPAAALTQGFDAGAAMRNNQYVSGGLQALGALASAFPDGGAAAGKGLGALHAIIAPLWHGSPHAFEKFALDKIGTGEGAQAYGHGLYFAENPEVAKDYQRNLSGASVKLPDGTVLNPASMPFATPDDQARRAAIQLLADYGDVRTARGGARTPGVHSELDKLAQLGATPVDSGHLYQVKLDANPEDFLNWDGGIDPRLQSMGLGPKPWRGNPAGPPTDLYYSDLTRNDESRSRLLNNGIQGVRYLDQGSRGAGQGTSNYVVFDPSIIDILNRQ